MGTNRALDALFDESGRGPNTSSDPRPLLNGADMILGVDRMSGRDFLVFAVTLYGTSPKRANPSGSKSSALSSIRRPMIWSECSP